MLCLSFLKNKNTLWVYLQPSPHLSAPPWNKPLWRNWLHLLSPITPVSFALECIPVMPSPPSQVSVLFSRPLVLLNLMGTLHPHLTWPVHNFYCSWPLSPCNMPGRHALPDFLLPPWLLLFSFLCVLVPPFLSSFLTLEYPRAQSLDLSFMYTHSFSDLIWSHRYTSLSISLSFSSQGPPCALCGQ